MYYISVGENWYPPELTAYDEQDGPLRVDYFGEYDVNVVGVYKITYVAQDSDGNVTYYYIYLHVLESIGDQPPADYPEMDEAALVELKARFQNERNKVLPKYTDPFDATVYYASLNGLTGQAFLNELRRIISTNITPTAYDDVRFILEKSDAVDSPWGTYLYGIYSGTKLVRYWDGGSTWNREHVWPNSKLGVKNQVDQAADPHNLRAISVSVNSYRSNRFFTNGDGSSSYHIVGKDGFYPGDDHRGDVARILFYMYVRYYDILTLVDTVEEILSGENYKPSGAKFGLLSVLLKWHYLDPVSEFERHRNNVIYSYQGNRNPFIDHPEYVSIIFNYELNIFNETFNVIIVIPKTEIDPSKLRKREYFS